MLMCLNTMMTDNFFFQIVPEASASYDGFRVMRDSINANHMDMAKFEHRQDVGYQRVWGHILRLIREEGPSKKGKGE
jgi:hypothetical protein